MSVETEDECIINQRIIGEYSQQQNGPLLICMAGIHGNEPAGIIALNRVFEILQEVQPDFKGTLVGLAGNLTALKEKERFIEKDLNRSWKDPEIERLHNTPKDQLTLVEDIEQKELLDLFDDYLDRPRDDFLFIDLHTTSAMGGVFSICSDDWVAKSIAVNLQVPVIIGVEAVFHGTTLNYFKSRKLPAIGFEAGQHESPHSVENMIASIFVLLHTMGCIQEEDIPGFALFETRLGKLGHNLPDILKFCYRFDVEDAHQFKMLPGFENFQFIKEGELMAFNNGEEVRAKTSGMLLMPLYQKKGEDGFFIVEPMSVEEL